MASTAVEVPAARPRVKRTSETSSRDTGRKFLVDLSRLRSMRFAVSFGNGIDLFLLCPFLFWCTSLPFAVAPGLPGSERLRFEMEEKIKAVRRAYRRSNTSGEFFDDLNEKQGKRNLHRSGEPP